MLTGKLRNQVDKIWLTFHTGGVANPISVTALDLEQLDEMLFKASGMKNRADYDQTIHPEKSLGVFIRELVGLDRHATKEAFAEFLDATRMNSSQIQFINTLIDYFTQNGVMEPQHLAQPPFSDIHSNSLFGLFDEPQVKMLSEKIRWINRNAEAANDERLMLMAAEPKPRITGNDRIALHAKAAQGDEGSACPRAHPWREPVGRLVA